MKKNKYIGENDMLYDNCRNVKFTGSEMPVFVCTIYIVNTIDFEQLMGCFFLKKILSIVKMICFF